MRFEVGEDDRLDRAKTRRAFKHSGRTGVTRAAVLEAQTLPGPEADDVPAGLARLAKRRFGAAAGVADVQRLSGGASQELWAFDVAAEGEAHPLILRRKPVGVVALTGQVDMATEARLITLAGRAGAPVPGVVQVLEVQDGLGDGFVMTRVEGEALAPRILRDPAYAQARPKLARQLGEAAARIHAIEDDALPCLPPRASLDQLEAKYRGFGAPRPVVEWALRWLHAHLPPPGGPVSVVHGDLRNGNIMVGPEGLRAVLDWEGAHRGDPMEDLGWLCVTSWRFGELDHPVGGFGSREELFAGYEAAGGAKVDPDRVRFWEVLGVLRWGVICASMADAFARGDRSVERAAIGRRISETDLDLLAMLAPRGGYRHA